MSVRLTMVAVNRYALTSMDRLSAHVIKAIAYHPIVQVVVVSNCL
jgi:hypothetical protein